MLYVEATAGDGNVDVRVLIQLPAVGMQGTENTDLNALPASPAEHGAVEQVVEQGPVVVEEGPQQVWHGKGDMLPFTVGQDVLLLRDPLLGGLHVAGASGL